MLCSDKTVIQRNCYTRVNISVAIQRILSGSRYCCDDHQPCDVVMKVREKDMIPSHRYDSVSIIHITPSKHKPPHMNFYS